MSRIRVAQIVEATVGGIREHLRQILTYLDRDRFELTLLYSALRDPDYVRLLAPYIHDGLNATQIPMKRAIRPCSDYHCYRRLLWEFRTRKFDIIHTHGSKSGMLGRFAAGKHYGDSPDRPLIIHTGHTFPTQWARRPMRSAYAAFERAASACTDHVIALTNAQKQHLLDQKICPAERIDVIPNALDYSNIAGPERRVQARHELALPIDAPVVGMVGRIVDQKAPLLFVQAAAEIARKRPRALFVWIGDGPLQDDMQQAVKEAGLAEKLFVTGFRHDVRELYAAFDVFLMTTRYEGMPYAVLEAMAASLPVVSANVPGIDEIVIQDKTGVTVAPDPQDMAIEVIDLLGNEERRRAYGTAARVHVETRHSEETFIETLQHLYETRKTVNGSTDSE